MIMRRGFLALAMALAIGLATAVSPLASSAPDGLERVAADHGFLAGEQLSKVQERAPAAGYAFPGVHDARLATGLAGFAGTLVVFLAGVGAARRLRAGHPAGARS
jgi:hypothetical protein